MPYVDAAVIPPRLKRGDNGREVRGDLPGLLILEVADLVHALGIVIFLFLRLECSVGVLFLFQVSLDALEVRGGGALVALSGGPGLEVRETAAGTVGMQADESRGGVAVRAGAVVGRRAVEGLAA